MSTTTEYMREYRRSGADKGGAARRKACVAAVAWLIRHHPDVWRGLLRDARESMGLGVEEGPGGTFTKPIAHGTAAGYQAELYRGLSPCPACRTAKNEAERNRYRNRRAS